MMLNLVLLVVVMMAALLLLLVLGMAAVRVEVLWQCGWSRASQK
jgi:hypothetical protein